MNEKDIEAKLHAARPNVRIKPGFSAHVMEALELQVAPSKKQGSTWAKFALPAFALLVIILGGTILQTHKSTAPSSTPSGQTAQINSGSTTNPSLPNSANDELASDVDKQIDTMTKQLAGLSNTDYADSNLSDASLYQ